MNETFVKYLSGLLDADGSLSLTFRQDPNGGDLYFAGLMLSLASSDAVDQVGFTNSLPALTGMGTVQRYGAHDQFVSWKVAKRSDLEVLLPRLIKHMVIKAQHWQWLITQWRTNRDGKRHGWTVSASEREELSRASKESRRTRIGPLKPKNHPTWAWLAGYLDGDGCYRRTTHVQGGYTQWTMNVSAIAHENDAVGLELIFKAFGGRIEAKRGHLREWVRPLGYQSRDFALRFLPPLAKHSRLKRDKIQAIISHHRQRLTVPGVERTYCKIEGCGGPSWGHHLCSKHYQQWRKGKLIVSDSLNGSLAV